jgi:hypothetical protein
MASYILQNQKYELLTQQVIRADAFSPAQFTVGHQKSNWTTCFDNGNL